MLDPQSELTARFYQRDEVSAPVFSCWPGRRLSHGVRTEALDTCGAEPKLYVASSGDCYGPREPIRVTSYSIVVQFDHDRASTGAHTGKSQERHETKWKDLPRLKTRELGWCRVGSCVRGLLDTAWNVKLWYPPRSPNLRSKSKQGVALACVTNLCSYGTTRSDMIL